MKVSIIIPTFQRSWGLKKALGSALQQSYQNIEVIVVDDCSQDDTPRVVSSFNDERMSYIRQPRNRGMVENWGDGLFRASGECVVFLADDDCLGGDFVKKRVARLSEAKNAAVTFSNYQVKEGDKLSRSFDVELWQDRQRLMPSELLTATLSRRWFIGTSIYRTSVIKELWPAITADDLVLDLGLNVRLALSGAEGVYCAGDDFVMLSHPGQNSQAKIEKVFMQTRDALKKVIAEGCGADAEIAIRRELSNWEVVWARRLAASDQIAEARRHLRAAISYDWTNGWAWRQAILAHGWAGRFSRTEDSKR